MPTIQGPFKMGRGVSLDELPPELRAVIPFRDVLHSVVRVDADAITPSKKEKKKESKGDI